YLSYALSDAGDLLHASAVLREALADDPEDTDPHMRIRLYWSLARLAEMEGRSSAALRHARRAIALLEATEDDHHQARAHVLAAWIMNSAGDGADARAELEKARALFGRTAGGDDAAMLAVELARSAALLGEGPEAEGHARRAIELSEGRYDAIEGGARSGRAARSRATSTAPRPRTSAASRSSSSRSDCAKPARPAAPGAPRSAAAAARARR